MAVVLLTAVDYVLEPVVVACSVVAAVAAVVAGMKWSEVGIVDRVGVGIGFGLGIVAAAVVAVAAVVAPDEVDHVPEPDYVEGMPDVAWRPAW